MVTLSFEGPGAQRRLTVFFRLILAIPHFVWALLLGIAGTVAVIAGWFAALVLGRLPQGIDDFLGEILQYWTRLTAYLWLMTDRYPPFSLTDRDYPVSVELPAATRLNRGAVLFRIILVIPVMFVMQLVTGGVGVALIVIWLVVLIAGRMPGSLWESEAVILRYQTRVGAYFGLLTSEYPRGLFGDEERTAPTAELDEPAQAWVPTTRFTRPRITRLVLSKAARRLVILFIVLGVLQLGANIAVNAIVAANSDDAADELVDSYVELDGEIRTFYTEAQRCALSGGPTCIQAANTRLASALTRFRADLGEIDFPLQAVGFAHDLEDDTAEMIAILNDMSLTTDAGAYQGLATRLQDVGARFDADLQELLRVLRY